MMWGNSYNSLENPIGIETDVALALHAAIRLQLQLIRKPDRD